MSKNTKQRLVATGFRLSGLLGEDYAKLNAVLTIDQLNLRARSAWVKLNSDGGRWTTAQCERSERHQTRCWERAQKIATSYKWKLNAPGPYWSLQHQGYDLLNGL